MELMISFFGFFGGKVGGMRDEGIEGGIRAMALGLGS
jgi:hypothetical protein